MEMVDPNTVVPQVGNLIPCNVVGVNQPYLFNGVQVVPRDGDPVLSTATFNVPGIPPEYVD